MSLQVNNNAYEVRITPSKRKRESVGANKENFVLNSFMEVKSIADLVKKKPKPSTENPYEVSRKPPKKKTRHDRDIDENCFVNPALNLNVPEKVINPFEVRRAPIVQSEDLCFSNPGLDIRVAERDVVNPFEIQRNISPPREVQGIDNPALDEHSTLAIGVPFTPTVGCRIDFKNLPIEALTPSSMLNTKLVFSPVKPTEQTPKRSNLSIISEEAVDISKELESYQSELENNMNEAKATRKRDNKNIMDEKKRQNVMRRLMKHMIDEGTEAVGDSKSSDEEKKEEIKTEEAVPPADEQLREDSNESQENCMQPSTPKTPIENCVVKYSLDKSVVNENPDVVFEEVEEIEEIEEENVEVLVEIETKRLPKSNDGELDFKNPTPFVRTYRRDVVRRPRPPTTGEVVGPTEAEEAKPKESHEMFGGIRSSIRKSIRKLMHSNSGKSKSTEDVSSKEAFVTPNGGPTTIFSSIRQSLRRKQPKQPLATSTPCASLNDISIIDNAPRAVFKEQNDAIAAIDKVFAMERETEDDANGNGFKGRLTIRRSLRKSSRHVMKSVFKKNIEDYQFDK